MRIPKAVFYRNNFYYVVVEDHDLNTVRRHYLKMTLGEYTYLTMTSKIKKSTRRFKRLGLLLVDFVFNTTNINIIKDIGKMVLKDGKVVALEYDERFLIFKENLVDETIVESDRIILTIGDEELTHRLYNTRTIVELNDSSDKFVIVLPKKFLVSVN